MSYILEALKEIEREEAGRTPLTDIREGVVTEVPLRQRWFKKPVSAAILTVIFAAGLCLGVLLTRDSNENRSYQQVSDQKLKPPVYKEKHSTKPVYQQDTENLDIKETIGIPIATLRDEIKEKVAVKELERPSQKPESEGLSAEKDGLIKMDSRIPAPTTEIVGHQTEIKTEISEEAGIKASDVQQKTTPSSTLESGTLSQDDERIPDVRIRGIFHVGAENPENLAIVQLDNGKKYTVHEGDTFSNIKVIRIFPKHLQLQYEGRTFETRMY